MTRQGMNRGRSAAGRGRQPGRTSIWPYPVKRAHIDCCESFSGMLLTNFIDRAIEISSGCGWLGIGSARGVVSTGGEWDSSRCDAPNIDGGFGRSDLSIKAAVRKVRRAKGSRRSGVSAIVTGTTPPRTLPFKEPFFSFEEAGGRQSLPDSDSPGNSSVPHPAKPVHARRTMGSE